MQSAKQIVLIDDDDASLGMMRDAFAEIGPKLTIRSWSNASDALAFLRGLADGGERAPDLIITDYRMQPVDGGAICRFLKTSDRLKHVPTIVLTGAQIEPDEKQNLPAEHVIIKPPEWKDLVELARQLKHRYLGASGQFVPVGH